MSMPGLHALHLLLGCGAKSSSLNALQKYNSSVCLGKRLAHVGDTPRVCQFGIDIFQLRAILMGPVLFEESKRLELSGSEEHLHVTSENYPSNPFRVQKPYQ